MILLPGSMGKRYAVLGLGKSGRASVASLLASGASVTAWDDAASAREAVQKINPDVTIAPADNWDFSSIAALVLSPGIFLSHPAVIAAKKSGVEVIGDIELLYRAQPNAKYIAITGTNGKSTTTTLIAHILHACGKRVEVGGNLGTPALALAPLAEEGIYVLELSSYQLDLVATTKFDVALLLNISPDHLDHHGSMENYIAAKRRIFERQGEADVAIIGVDDAVSESICRDMLVEPTQMIIPISASQKIDGGVYAADSVLHNTLMEDARAGTLAGVKALQGAHNWQNAAAAYAACFASGCAHEAILAAIQAYPGLAHRMQWLGEIHGVQFVNDSKATNADAAEKALLTYENIFWIAGGVAKEGGIAPLAKYFPKIRHAYLIGEAADDFAKTLEGHVPYSKCITLENAFQEASRAASMHAQAKPVVLLAPACASFDQFANFEKRGEAFVAFVEALNHQGGTHAPAA